MSSSRAFDVDHFFVLLLRDSQLCVLLNLALLVRGTFTVTATEKALRLVTSLTRIIMLIIRATNVETLALFVARTGTDPVRTARPSPIRNLGARVVRVSVEGVRVVFGLGRNRGKNQRETVGVDLELAGITVGTIRAVKAASSITLLPNDAADISTSADVVSSHVGVAGEIGITAVSGVGLEGSSLLVAGARNLATIVEYAGLVVGAAGARVLSEGGLAAVPDSDVGIVVGIGVISGFDFGSCLDDGGLEIDGVGRLGALGVLVEVGITLSAGGADHGGMGVDAQVAGIDGFGRAVVVVSVAEAMVGVLLKVSVSWLDLMVRGG